MSTRHNPAELIEIAANIFAKAGLDEPKARTVAEILVEADLTGHTTHGLALAPWYLESIDQGVMAKSGEPTVISDRGASIAWDGNRLPGAWLTVTALDLAIERSAQFGTAVVAIGNSHHIGSLSAYLTRATDKGLMAMVASSSPSAATVAPFGGTKGVFTPDPLAAGIPTSGDPILVDISASITTNNMTSRLQAEGKRFEHPWLMEANGTATTDPQALSRGGTVLPTGGLDHGQKGYGMALLVESLTQGLSGIGRANEIKGTNASIYLQVFDPEAFAGHEAFVRQTDWLADACRTNPPRPGVERVRLPGDRAAQRKRDALTNGLDLHPGIIDKLRPWAERYGEALPG